VWNDPAHALVAHRSRAAVIVDVPVQYYQSVIATEVAVTGVLLFQIRFFDTRNDQRNEASADPRLRLLMLIVLTATLFGSLEAIRESAGRWAAVLVTVGLAISLLPILLRVLPTLGRDAQTRQRSPHFWVTVAGLTVYAAIIALVVSIN
jgi:glucose-6-phosphate-specific signal transduction histidine kinase